MKKYIELSLKFTSLLIASSFWFSTAHAADADADTKDLAAQLAVERATLAEVRRDLEEQRGRLRRHQQRLEAMEARILGSVSGTGAPGVQGQYNEPQVAQSGASSDSTRADLERVGEKPDDATPPEIPILGDQGGIITRQGRWTLEPSVEYTHADRSRVLFRGIELIESVLVGVFDINETRQDALTASIAARYGITNRFEISARVPYVYRADRTVLAPIAGSNNPPGSTSGATDMSAEGDGIGDVEATLRYQLTNGRDGWPFLIANLQTVIPTGGNPFKVRRDATGAPLEATTGSGFWGIQPSITAILVTDPAILFATLGYTHNLGRHQNTLIGTVQVDYVKPGDSPSASFGVGVSLNERTAINFGYAHSWAFGTTIKSRIWQTSATGQPLFLAAQTKSKSRSLQVGRYLFGISYRLSEKSTLNWAVEIGATDDAPNVHLIFRVPFTF